MSKKKRQMEIRIERIEDRERKSAIVREVLESLRQWFEVDESRERYIEESKDLPLWCALDGNGVAGFICLKETGKETVELHVTGVKKEYHRQGLGRKLFEAAYEDASKEGYSFFQVKTVKEGIYEDYDRTNRFYRSLGFKEFEVIPEIWGKENPCQIYVMDIKR